MSSSITINDALDDYVERLKDDGVFETVPGTNFEKIKDEALLGEIVTTFRKATDMAVKFPTVH